MNSNLHIRGTRLLATTLALPAALMLVGCGGPDFATNAGRNTVDNGLSGNYGGFAGGNGAAGRQGTAVRGRGVYPKQETSFNLPDVKGNAFDYSQNDVIVTVSTPDSHSLKIPAFFDGEKTWRVRFTPEVSGRFAISGVTLNGQTVQPEKLEKREFDVSGSPLPGFVRRDTRDKSRFVYENGNSYYPIGHNLESSDKTASIEGRMEKMGKAGENWSRIWMAHWEGRNLDWVEGQKVQPGTISLDVAKRWDSIVQAAEKNGIYFQMVLQHHGQFSTKVDPNWASNPWNKANGGWLSTPDEFFTDQKAIALTKAKYRYIIARWGYSPNIMAWELFNEIENTDSIAHKHGDEVTAWHRAMAAFIRQQDPDKHLITTSSDVQLAAAIPELDFAQPHAYASDALNAGLVDGRKLDKPIFLGEFGPAGNAAPTAAFAHAALWAGVMSGASGAPGLWNADTIDKEDLYSQFHSAEDFVKQSGLLGKRALLAADTTIDTSGRGDVVFGPGAGWGGSQRTEYTVSSNGSVEGLGALAAYFQGSAHKDLFSGATFKVSFPEAGTFRVSAGKVAPEGGHLVISVDGAKAAEKDFPGSGKESASDAVIQAKVPAGAHEVKLENTGADWVMVKEFALSSYGPALQAMGRAGKDYAALWISNRGEKEIGGKVSVAGVQAGAYRATWWDTAAGKTISDDAVTVASGSPLTLTVPPVQHDVAVYVEKANQKAAAKTPSSKKKHT